MTLEELIIEYLGEEYNFFKYRDKDGNEIRVMLHFDSHHSFLEQYMKYYREMPSLETLIEDATLGIIKIEQSNNKIYYIRHPHQEVFTDNDGKMRGISHIIAQEVKQNLLQRIEDLRMSSVFPQIMDIVEQCRVKGFGELSIYDTAVRIGAFLGIAPDMVYLHAGTRKGIEQLEVKGYLPKGASKQKSIAVNDMPDEFKKLTPDDIQHFACLKKKEIELELTSKPLSSLQNDNNNNTEKNLSSAEQSARLFLLCHDVTKVASERNLAETTVYKHLFERKVLDPYDYISKQVLEKIDYLMANFNEENSHEIKKIFSSLPTRSAYYYLQSRK